MVCPCCAAPSDAPRCDLCGAAAAPGGYRVLGLLAQTPHGRLYLAADGERRIALKELVFALAPDAKTIDAFEREAQVLAALDHPAIPRFVRSFREGAGVHVRLYLAQELIDGEPLQRLDEPQAREVARQVLHVLGYLHARRVLHRDVKPANLLRRKDGKISLVDFGVARELKADVTHGATLVGTFGYMPIEQLGGTVDERSDLYALGATLLHLLTGTAPAELMKHNLSLDFSQAGSLRPFLEKLSALQRRDRYGSAREALAALDAPAPVRIPLRERVRAWFARLRQRRGTPYFPEVVRLPLPVPSRERVQL